MKWRPVVSCAAHHWKRLFTVTCFVINFIANFAFRDRCFDSQSVAELHDKMNVFNNLVRDCGGDGEGGVKLQVRCRDIDSFYTKCPRSGFLQALRKAVTAFKLESACQYVAVPKGWRRRGATRRWVFAPGPQQCH